MFTDVYWYILYATGFSELDIDLMTSEFSAVLLTVTPDTKVMERLNININRAISAKVGFLKKWVCFLEAACGLSSSILGNLYFAGMPCFAPLGYNFTTVAISMLEAFY